MGRLTEQLTPRVLAVFTFLAGVRAAVLRRDAGRARDASTCSIACCRSASSRPRTSPAASPAPAAAAVAGAGAPARCRLLPAVVAAIVVGIVASLLKGVDYEEAALLLGAAARCCGARGPPSIAARRSSRRASRPAGSPRSRARSARRSWLGLFAFKHVDYSHELWWQFELHGEASRFLRASVGAGDRRAAGRGRAAGRPSAPHEIEPPTDARSGRCRRASSPAQPATSAEPRLPPRQGPALRRRARAAS